MEPAGSMQAKALCVTCELESVADFLSVSHGREWFPAAARRHQRRRTESGAGKLGDALESPSAKHGCGTDPFAESLAVTGKEHVNLNVVNFVGSADLSAVTPPVKLDEASNQAVTVGTLVSFECGGHGVVGVG